MSILRTLGCISIACSLSGVASSAASQLPAEAPPPTLVAWSKLVYQHMDRQLAYPSALFGREPDSGVVAVKFNCSDSGAPAGVALYKSSGSPSLDAATIKAVRKIVTLHPLPAGMMHDQQFVMKVLFATSAEEEARQSRQLREEAEKANAWFRKSDRAVTTALVLAPAG